MSNKFTLEYINSRKLFKQNLSNQNLPPNFNNRTYEVYPIYKITHLCDCYQPNLSPVKFKGGDVVDQSKMLIFSICKEKETVVRNIIQKFKPNILDSDLHRIILKLEMKTQNCCADKPNVAISKIINGLKQFPSLEFIKQLADLYDLSILYCDGNMSVLYNTKHDYYDKFNILRTNDEVSNHIILYTTSHITIIPLASLPTATTPPIKI